MRLSSELFVACVIMDAVGLRTLLPEGATGCVHTSLLARNSICAGGQLVFARESFPSLGENVSREAPRQSSRVAPDVIMYHCINMNECDTDSLRPAHFTRGRAHPSQIQQRHRARPRQHISLTAK